MPLIIPTELREKNLGYMYSKLMDFKENQNADSLAKAVQRMLKEEEFAKTVAITFPRGLNNVSDLQNAAWAYLQTMLYKRDYFSAALFLWGKDAYDPGPHASQLIFDGLFNNVLVNVLGAGSCSKTYSASAWTMIDWLLDPEWTRVQVASNSEDHVKKNLYGDLVRLHQSACLPLPGIVDTESISIDKKTSQGIFVLTIPGGPRAKGKLKGAKIKSRPPHPLFGTSSRLRIILDEAQEIPASIFEEIPNLLSSVDGDATEHIKIYCSANPKDEWSQYGLNSKPPGGFEKLAPNQETWISENGWHCIRLNAMLTENVVMRKTIFKRMITWEGVQAIIKSCGGDTQHPRVWSLVYGMFPQNGNMAAIIKGHHLRASEGEWIFNGPTISYASFDPAFTGDLPAMATGRAGKAIAWEDYSGNRHELHDPRYAAQVDSIGILPRGDTQDLADEFMARVKQLNVKPENAATDKTGPGLGVHDIICRQWKDKVSPDAGHSAPIYGINYAQSPTQIKICEEDSQTPDQTFDRICSELWYGAAKMLEYDYVRIGRAVEPTVFEELAARMGGSKVGAGKKQSVEAKSDYKARTAKPSPDRADAFTMLLQVMRCTNPDLIPKAKDTEKEKPESGRQVQAWHGFELAFGASELNDFSSNIDMADMQKD